MNSAWIDRITLSAKKICSDCSTVSEEET
uniref:Uncharacterized protein n=1 Tax=Oryza nivara TaxID=4536 RepID=A0A0E0GZU4_ORYNI